MNFDKILNDLFFIFRLEIVIMSIFSLIDTVVCLIFAAQLDRVLYERRIAYLNVSVIGCTISKGPLSKLW